MAGSLVAVSAAPASAIHCTLDPDDLIPGYSEFAGHVRGETPHGTHVPGSHQGWSGCLPQAQSGR